MSGVWSIETSSFDGGAGALFPVWNPTDSVFVGVSGANAYKSTDGITWDVFPLPTDYTASGLVAWSPSLGLYAVSGFNTVTGRGEILTSPDGETWTANSLGAPSVDIVTAPVWAAGLGLFLAAVQTGGSTTSAFVSSSDGASWSRHSSPSSSILFLELCWSEDVGRAVAFGYNPGDPSSPIFLAHTTSGTSWANGSMAASVFSPSFSIQWSTDLGLFAAVATTTLGALDNSIITSPDGLTWTIQTVPRVNDSGTADNGFWANVCAVAGAFFCQGATFDVDPTKYVMMSDDGVTWTTIDTGVIWNGSVFSGGGAVFAPALSLYRSYPYSTDIVANDSFTPPTSDIVIYDVNPASGDVAGGEYVEILGSGFDVNVQAVFANIFPLELIWNDQGSLTARTPPHMPAEKVNVTVTNPDDGDFDTGVEFFEYTDFGDTDDLESGVGPPHIGSGDDPHHGGGGGGPCAPGAVVPNSGTMFGGTNVTINGAGFVSGMQVFFDDDEATNVVVVNENQITCTTPAHLIGAVNVSVVTP